MRKFRRLAAVAAAVAAAITIPLVTVAAAEHTTEGRTFTYELIGIAEG